MAKRKLLSRFQRFWFSSRRRNSIKGFTLLELLVTTAIAGGIVSGLLFIVVQLMSVDQRESAQSTTQQEMQLALNYISTEMRDAVYVYTGKVLAPENPPSTPPRRNGQSLMDFLPTSLSTNSFPVIAFWKQQPFPDAIKLACAGSTPPAGVSCSNGSSYALVVYSLSTHDPDDTWKGNARITRYALTEFSSTGASTVGYVNPGVYNNNFDTWPYGTNETGLVNLQTARPSSVTPAALVDFVDNAGSAGACPNATTTGVSYDISPKAGVRSFYACVNDRQTLGDSQDVLIYLRGNVAGRPGASLASPFLPTLETRVLSRGVLGRVPTN
ncbi:MAG: type II secretion system GspH family protein [Timaviella obliquedivisa GSE-PSE-MK23-08B]|jgi:prepilin-type N-terminal cleavage/methylation domain-containing protein|nr:type II secretion system GspH family protein [Timaviella obliquedivisa GSE-PSE-MK23-08B]